LRRRCSCRPAGSQSRKAKFTSSLGVRFLVAGIFIRLRSNSDVREGGRGDPQLADEMGTQWNSRKGFDYEKLSNGWLLLELSIRATGKSAHWSGALGSRC
jgi:hypothetical protein